MEWCMGKHYSFLWNSNVYMLRKRSTGESEKANMYGWVAAFEPDAYGNILTQHHGTPEVCFKRQEKYRGVSSSSVSTIKQHDSFIDMLSYWASDRKALIR